MGDDKIYEAVIISGPRKGEMVWVKETTTANGVLFTEVEGPAGNKAAQGTGRKNQREIASLDQRVLSLEQRVSRLEDSRESGLGRVEPAL